MNSRELVDDLRRRYAETIKPRIQAGNYFRAYVELDKIIPLLRISKDDIIADLHCGLACISAAEKLYRELGEGEPSKETIEEFEAFSAQTQLPRRGV